MVLRTAVMQEVREDLCHSYSFHLFSEKVSINPIKAVFVCRKIKEKNLRLITEKDFDFIIRLLVISYLVHSCKNRLLAYVLKQLFLSFSSLFFFLVVDG
jgi:uncharacterized Fe-S radical SAM superfamily protein PflX